MPYHLAMAPFHYEQWDDHFMIARMQVDVNTRRAGQNARPATKKAPLRFPFGAGYEIRTRDFHLGKVTLYH